MVMNNLHGKKIKTVFFVHHPAEVMSSTLQLMFWIEEYADRTESWVVELENNIEICRYNIKDITKIVWLL